MTNEQIAKALLAQAVEDQDEVQRVGMAMNELLNYLKPTHAAVMYLSLTLMWAALKKGNIPRQRMLKVAQEMMRFVKEIDDLADKKEQKH